MVTTYTLGTLGQEFDKMFYSLTNSPATGSVNYPPYNVIEIDKDEWVLQFAIAGFTKDNIEVTTHKGVLTVKGEKEDEKLEDGQRYLHKGIAGRKFVRSFTLPEYTEVLKAQVVDGILSITLVRSVPEEQKPKSITIK